MPLFDFKNTTIKIRKSYIKTNKKQGEETIELTLPIKQLFLAFDLWRLYLGFGEGRTVANQVTFEYNGQQYGLSSFVGIKYDIKRFNEDEMDINKINQVRQALFKIVK